MLNFYKVIYSERSLNYFGIVERFSVFAATGYNAVLGIELYRMKFYKV